jgi:hypothetical protein
VVRLRYDSRRSTPRACSSRMCSAARRGAVPPWTTTPASMLCSTADWVRFTLLAKSTRRSATAILACIFEPGVGRMCGGQCHSTTPATPANAIPWFRAAQGAARALERLHHDRHLDSAADRRLQACDHRLVRPCRVGDQQDLALRLRDERRDHLGGGTYRHPWRRGAAPHDLDPAGRHSTRVAGGDATEVRRRDLSRDVVVAPCGKDRRDQVGVAAEGPEDVLGGFTCGEAVGEVPQPRRPRWVVAASTVAPKASTTAPRAV